MPSTACFSGADSEVWEGGGGDEGQRRQRRRQRGKKVVKKIYITLVSKIHYDWAKTHLRNGLRNGLYRPRMSTSNFGGAGPLSR